MAGYECQTAGLGQLRFGEYLPLKFQRTGLINISQHSLGGAGLGGIMRCRIDDAGFCNGTEHLAQNYHCSI